MSRFTIATVFAIGIARIGRVLARAHQPGLLAGEGHQHEAAARPRLLRRRRARARAGPRRRRRCRRRRCASRRGDPARASRTRRGPGGRSARPITTACLFEQRVAALEDRDHVHLDAAPALDGDGERDLGAWQERGCGSSAAIDLGLALGEPRTARRCDDPARRLPAHARSPAARSPAASGSPSRGRHCPAGRRSAPPGPAGAISSATAPRARAFAIL